MKRQGRQGAKVAKVLLDGTAAGWRASKGSATSEEQAPYGQPRRREPTQRADALARSVIGAAIAVHRELGPGFPEVVYQRALAIELEALGIPFEREQPFTVCYRGASVGKGQLDFLVGDILVVELKAVEAVLPLHRAQVTAYLKALKLELGLLINFNTQVLKHGIERVVRT
ncbi:MAG: GxxExxY protein [Myxococcales bacterium]